MSDNAIDPSLPSVDSSDEYPQVTQSDLDRAKFRVGLKLAADENEIERTKLVNSVRLRLILGEAEARIRATGGIKHEDIWSQLDTEYQHTERQGDIVATGDNK